MMWQIQDGMGWWMLFGAVWMVLFWAAVIGLIVWVINGLIGKSSPRKPLEIAQERFARGEISAEQYEAIRQRLA